MSRNRDNRSLKPAIFHKGALEEIREFPEEVRREVGKLIFDLQEGRTLGMPVARVMRSVGKGVSELRVKDGSGAYRVFYFVKTESGVFIFHAFEKRTQKTPDREIALGRQRLKELLDENE